MTYNLLIVEDEHMIRKGLKQTLPWEEYDVRVVADACDGVEAKQTLHEHHVDIILTDIRMPNMDGLSLASYVAEHAPHIKVIMISGYDDFAYAQQALKIGVQDYLLKPVDIEELLAIIQTVTTEISKERQNEEHLQKTLFKQAIYRQVWGASLDPVHEGKAVSNHSVLPVFSMVKHFMERTESLSLEEMETFKQMWQQKVETRLHQLGMRAVSMFTEQNLLLTCILDSPDKETVRNALRSLDCAIHLVYPKEVAIGALHRTYPEMIEQLSTLPLHKQQPVWEVAEIHFEERLPPESLLEEWLQAVFQLEKESAVHHVEEVLSYMDREHFSFTEVQSTLSLMYKRMASQFESLVRKEIDTGNLYDGTNLNPWDVHTYSYIKSKWLENLEELFHQLHAEQNNPKAWMIERALDYIQTYYTSEIKAHEVADVINLSPNYFSSLFKQQTGRKFNEYIHELRIAHAKTLLTETPFKVSEIAEQVGYQEYKYFVKIFKKQSGMTPTKYRKLMAIQS